MKNTITPILAVLLLTVITACSNLLKSEDPIDEGTGAPDFSLQSLDGTQVNLADFSEQVVLLFFFGNG